MSRGGRSERHFTTEFLDYRFFWLRLSHTSRRRDGNREGSAGTYSQTRRYRSLKDRTTVSDYDSSDEADQQVNSRDSSDEAVIRAGKRDPPDDLIRRHTQLQGIIQMVVIYAVRERKHG